MLNKVVRNRPTKQTIQKFLKQASLSGGIWRSHEIAQMSNLVMKNPILDIGCGDGSFVKLVFKGQMDYGLDIQESNLIKAKKSGVYKYLLESSAEAIPLKDNSVYTVFSNSVFEHIKNMDSVLSEISRVLKKDGLLIFTTHSPSSKNFYLVKVLRKIHINFLANLYEKVFISQLQLNTLWPIKEWQKKLILNGFEVLEIKTIISPRAAFFYEILQPFTYFQNRISILKKFPLTFFLLILFNTNFYKEDQNGRDFYITAKKVVK